MLFTHTSFLPGICGMDPMHGAKALDHWINHDARFGLTVPDATAASPYRQRCFYAVPADVTWGEALKQPPGVDRNQRPYPTESRERGEGIEAWR